MSFHSLNAPRKIHSLDAEIRGAAVLANPGLVAMVSTDPVRLGVCPLGGSAGKTTNISLSSADDVALLSKDAAVVRSEGDVWAVLGIQHSPKIDQVGRDARLLAARPGGETALGLGWDESATEFKLVKNDVEGRQFVLRGSVRAFDVTEAETYAVVDAGGEGGELRVHPGATPEPGASHRATLPREAKGLDRVRGGQQLSAIYKRGGSAVCAVVKSAGKLVAKMITLEAAAVDVAVLEGSLFVAFADGRIAIYSDAAIEGATGAALAPTNKVQLGGRGEPRVIVATAKGGATLWIGTSAGEIFSAAIARKSAG
ncbi:hypothetical protein [Chondromyces apiculatus]|uniref:Uncharacterized protein n=1 Tax=Chondromyces apiculatus DSM 436 TaxID=1192034 RepID=A0A017T6V2_9BACT|nr:hypothetical protein [Chondromyces apiculatus]EYF04742.1 Hypothetical protein CAP_4218 [Chondromyces apiculatus DSM 436]